MLFEEAVDRYLNYLLAGQEGSRRAWSSALRRAAQAPGTYEKPKTDSKLNAADKRKAQARAGKPRPGLGGKQLDEVQPEELKAVLHAIQQEARSRRNGVGGFGAQETAKTALRSLYAWARDNGHTQARPDASLVYSKRSALERRAYTNAELESVIAVLDRTRDPELARLFLRLALETGGRHSELLQLTWGDLREQSGVVRLTPKGFAGEHVDAPITAPLFEALVAFVRTRSIGAVRPATHLLLSKSGKPLTRRYWEHVCEIVRAEVPSLGTGEPDWFSAHGLRHTAATLIQRAAGDAVARKFLGHSARGRSHMETYAKATIDEVREAMVAVWGAPLAGHTHDWGVNGKHFLRLDALRESKERHQRYDDAILNHLAPWEHEGNPDFYEAVIEDQEQAAIGQDNLLRRMGLLD